jgi:hypothetical protein
MQLVVARVAAAAAVASEESVWTSLEAVRQSVEDRTTTAEATAVGACQGRGRKPPPAEEAAERAKTAATATETAARDAVQAAAREKAALEMRVSELERDLGTATTDLPMTGHQFS